MVHRLRLYAVEATLYGCQSHRCVSHRKSGNSLHFLLQYARTSFDRLQQVSLSTQVPVPEGRKVGMCCHGQKAFSNVHAVPKINTRLARELTTFPFRKTMQQRTFSRIAVSPCAWFVKSLFLHNHGQNPRCMDQVVSQHRFVDYPFVSSPLACKADLQ